MSRERFDGVWFDRSSAHCADIQTNPSYEVTPLISSRTALWLKVTSRFCQAWWREVCDSAGVFNYLVPQQWISLAVIFTGSSVVIILPRPGNSFATTNDIISCYSRCPSAPSFLWDLFELDIVNTFGLNQHRLCPRSTSSRQVAVTNSAMASSESSTTTIPDFLRLPPENRLRVYQLYFKNAVVRFARSGDRVKARVTYKSPIHLMMVCKMVYLEARSEYHAILTLALKNCKI